MDKHVSIACRRVATIPYIVSVTQNLSIGCRHVATIPYIVSITQNWFAPKDWILFLLHPQLSSAPCVFVSFP